MIFLWLFGGIQTLLMLLGLVLLAIAWEVRDQRRLCRRIVQLALCIELWVALTTLPFGIGLAHILSVPAGW